MNTLHVTRLCDKVKKQNICQWGPSWSWSYGSWIYKYVCSHCISPLTLWVLIPLNLSVACDRSVVFSGYSGSPHQWNWPPRYNWTVVERDVNHHDPNCNPQYVSEMGYNNWRNIVPRKTLQSLHVLCN
jgi:hypothetical protein